MKRLLQIELFKLRHNRAARVITLLYFLFITFIAFIASIEFDFANIHFRLADQGIFNFPFIWHFNTYMAAILKLFLAIVIVSMMSNEYSYRTLKQNLIDGMSKKEMITSKFLTVLFFSVISTVFIFLTSLILGLIFSDYKEFGIIFTGMGYIGAYFLKLVAFFSFCLFLGVLVRRSAFALGFLIVWQVFEWIAYSLLRFQVFRNSEIADVAGSFFPLASMSNLIKEPFTRLGAIQSAATQLGETITKDYGIHWYEVLIVCGWIVVFVYGSYALLKRRDL